MSRILTLRIKDIELPAKLEAFSRNTLYGKSTVEKRSLEGKVYKNAYLTVDGMHVLPPKSTSSCYINTEGEYVSKTLLVNSEDQAIPIEKSMFEEPVNLIKTINIDNYFNYNIEITYIITSKEKEALSNLYQECKKLLVKNKLYRFNYAYFNTIDPKTAILIPKNETLFVVVGVFIEPIMLIASEILYSDIEMEKEEESEEIIAFEVW